MSYLSDYLFFNTGNECPENYHIMSALTLASAVISRKVYIDWGQSRVYLNLYSCLVGRQGLRKSTAKDIARDILELHFPDIPQGADVSSSQGLATWLATEECTFSFIDEKGIAQEYHPGIFLINELKHFLGVNPQGMLEFLTDIYDKPFFKSKYKNAGSDVFPRPYLVMIACETPSWILSKLKIEMISGGFARRLIPVYEQKRRTNIPRPFITQEMQVAKTRCVDKLKSARPMVGPMVWDKEAETFYDKYYLDLQKDIPTDPLMEGFHSSQHTQILKIAALLTVIESQDLILRRDMLEISIELVERLKPGMEELYKGAGRNDLAQPTNTLIAYIESRGGIISEKEFRISAGRDMKPYEIEGVIANLQKTEQIVVLQQTNSIGVSKRMIATKEKADQLTKKPSA